MNSPKKRKMKEDRDNVIRVVYECTQTEVLMWNHMDNSTQYCALESDFEPQYQSSVKHVVEKISDKHQRRSLPPRPLPRTQELTLNNSKY